MHRRTRVSIRKVVGTFAALTLALAIAAPAAAQNNGVLFGAGVSFLNDEGETITGFALDVMKDVKTTDKLGIGVFGDFGWHRKSDDSFGGDFTTKIMTNMGGVRASFVNASKATPYAQLGIGVARFSASGDICDDFGGCESESELAMAPGFGVDVKLNDKWNFRAALDFIVAFFEDESDWVKRFTIGVSTRLGGM